MVEGGDVTFDATPANQVSVHPTLSQIRMGATLLMMDKGLLILQHDPGSCRYHGEGQPTVAPKRQRLGRCPLQAVVGQTHCFRFASIQ
jgi:hypothetical protein